MCFQSTCCWPSSPVPGSSTRVHGSARYTGGWRNRAGRGSSRLAQTRQPGWSRRNTGSTTASRCRSRLGNTLARTCHACAGYMPWHPGRHHSAHHHSPIEGALTGSGSGDGCGDVSTEVSGGSCAHGVRLGCHAIVERKCTPLLEAPVDAHLSTTSINHQDCEQELGLRNTTKHHLHTCSRLAML